MTPKENHPTPSDSPHLSRAELRAKEEARKLAALKRKLLLGGAAVALVISALISALLYDVMVEQKSAANLEQLAEKEVQNRKLLLEDYWRTQTTTIDRLSSNQDIIDSLTQDNPANSDDQRAQLARSLTRAIPSALSLRIFPLGSASLNRDTQYPIRYAELDLIQRAEAGQTPLPEVVAIENRWLVNWARPILAPGQSQPLGSLLLVVDASELFSLFGNADQRLGQYQLQQVFSGSPTQTITKIGTSELLDSHQLPVAGSHLQVKFTPSAYFVDLTAEAPTQWLLVTAVILALLLGAAWLVQQQVVKKLAKRKPQQDPLLGDLVPHSKKAKSEDALANPLFQTQDILDIAMIDEDENVLGLSEGAARRASGSAPARLNEEDVPREIFRAYDIRGIAGSQITPELALLLGQAIGSEALDQGEQAILVARDGRTHSEGLCNALIKGILKSGCNVINLGLVPTPLMYFASFHCEDTSSGVMVTASHNPKEYNGFKVVINNNALADDGVLELRSRILGQRLHQGAGVETTREIIPDYIDRIFSDVALASNVTLVIDAGNAVPGLVAPRLFEELGCDVIPLYCELDGNFPNHQPDPSDEKNLSALIAKVKETNADMGVAFDGDGDRLVVVTPKGDIIWPDRMLMLFARDVLSRHPGADVVFDVKCSRQLNQVISGYGGRPIMWKTGHSPMKAKMVETGALIGGEYSGHIFIKDRWYGFDDGLYAMARLLEIITLRDQPIDEIFAGFPPMLITPEIKVAVSEQEKFALIEKLAAEGDFQNGSITDIDGLRVDFPKGWGLVRASNTSPALTLRFEAESDEVLAKIKQLFKRELLKVNSSLSLNF